MHVYPLFYNLLLSFRDKLRMKLVSFYITYIIIIII